MISSESDGAGEELVKLRAPAVFGDGQNPRNFCDWGLIRLAGIWLPGKGCPVDGSVIAFANRPVFSFAVGTGK